MASRLQIQFLLFRTLTPSVIIPFIFEYLSFCINCRMICGKTNRFFCSECLIHANRIKTTEDRRWKRIYDRDNEEWRRMYVSGEGEAYKIEICGSCNQIIKRIKL